MDLQKGVGVVVVIGKQDFDLKILEIPVDFFVFFFEQFKKLRIVVPVELIELFQNAFDTRQILFVSGLEIPQPVGLLDDALGLLLIRPEVFFILLCFQLFDSLAYRREVKESRLNLLTSLRKCLGSVSFHKFPYLLFLYDNLQVVAESHNIR